MARGIHPQTVAGRLEHGFLSHPPAQQHVAAHALRHGVQLQLLIRRQRHGRRRASRSCATGSRSTPTGRSAATAIDEAPRVGEADERPRLTGDDGGGSSMGPGAAIAPLHEVDVAHRHPEVRAHRPARQHVGGQEHRPVVRAPQSPPALGLTIAQHAGGRGRGGGLRPAHRHRRHAPDRTPSADLTRVGARRYPR